MKRDMYCTNNGYFVEENLFNRVLDNSKCWWGKWDIQVTERGDCSAGRRHEWIIGNAGDMKMRL
jgi:hypothetical protein